MQDGLDWEQVRLFLAIARERSLSGAGARLAMDVSTVSRRLDRLEEKLGALLFDRTREGTTPTSLAEQMLPHAEEMEVAAARFSSAGAFAETAVEGVVRLTVPPGIADALVAPALVRLYEKHPKLLVELDASVGYANLTRRDADLAIRSTKPATGELVVTKLVSARATPLASADYARTLGKVRRLEDVRFVVYGADLAHLPDGVWLRKHSPNPRIVLRTSHFASQVAAARAGLGAVITPLPLASGLVPIAHARSLDDAWADLPVGTLWLVGHRALRSVPRVAAVWRFLLEIFAEP